jgi:hypothetical protein
VEALKKNPARCKITDTSHVQIQRVILHEKLELRCSNGLRWLIYSSIAANNNAPYVTVNLPTIYSAFMVTEN